ncbi:MAG: hypothetical protein GYA17_20885 [Chloroflexi bacterium]|nr:hypothetical protein [Chloroflexota bacterium]
MVNDGFVKTSRRVFAALLKLYPRQHRDEYGADMLQLFTDQCKEAAGLHPPLYRIALWLRTLGDLFVNAIKEHASLPSAGLGLLEAPPNAPLPWKGVALVLLPGLIFFAGQVGQLTGLDWFYWLVYRGAYYMIVPVLLVWAWKRKFPLWGLMPLGLLYATLALAGRRFEYLVTASPAFYRVFRHIDTLIIIFKGTVVAGAILGAVFLAWRLHRRGALPRRAWYWLGLYALLTLTHVIAATWDYAPASGLTWQALITEPWNAKYREDLLNLVFYSIYDDGAFLILVLLGGLLARRHERLAVLLPLGYLLPSVVYGRVSNDWPAAGSPELTLILVVAVAALAYRFLVALAGPLWIVRSASGERRKRAGAVTVLALLAIQVAFSLWQIVANAWGGMLWVNYYYMFAEELVLGSGIGLALALYHPVPAGQAEPTPALPGAV